MIEIIDNIITIFWWGLGLYILWVIVYCFFFYKG